AFAGRNELVEQDLRAIGEIAKLRLPQRQSPRIGKAVTILEAEHRFFRQHGIDDLIACLRGREDVQRNVAPLVALIVKHRMALAEGAALRILARKPDRVALEQDRPEGQRFGGRPVDALAGFDGVAAIVEKSLDGAMYLEILRYFGQLPADFLQGLYRHGRLAAAKFVLAVRSEEHTSELQSRENLVCRLLLEKKKQI